MGLLDLFRSRVRSREDCPYCKSEKPAFEMGGTPYAFGYPSVKFGCCGKIAFQYVDRKTGNFMRWIKVGNGHAEWLPKDQYFAYLEETNKPRAYREGSPHQGKIERPKKEARAEATPPTGIVAVASVAPSTAPEIKAAQPAPTSGPIAFVSVASVADIPPGKSKVVVVNNRRVALFNLGGTFHAIDDTCRHAGRSLGEGGNFEDDGFVTCAGHGWRYDVRTGATEHNPDVGVRRYDVRVENGRIVVGA